MSVIVANHVFRRVVPIHASERWIDGNILAVKGGLKDPFHGVLKNAPIPLLALHQLLFHPLPFGNISGNPAQGIRLSVSTVQGKLGDNTRVRTIVMYGDFFKFERTSSLKYLEIIGTKRSGLLGRKDVLIRFAHDLLASYMERSFELAIDMEIASFCILQKHHPWTVIENGSESRFTFAEFFLSSLAFGDVQQGRPPMGDTPGLIVNREALEIEPARDVCLFPETHLTGLSRACLQHLLTMPVQEVSVIR